jgi:hypothetical protein
MAQGGWHGGYEFSAAENVVIGRAGARARVWGIIAIILGGVMLLFAGAAFAIGGKQVLFIAGSVATTALVPLVAGKLYVDAGHALAAVVDTQGHDIAYVMQSMTKLRNAFRLESILGIVAIILGILLAMWAAKEGIDLRAR